jgi:hypothetical protein
MKEMLIKGDELRDEYRDFDFSKLDSQQQRWLSALSVFTKYRSLIERQFEPRKISNDLKIIFV